MAERRREEILMDLKVYYRKLREIVKDLEEEFVVVSSLATPDGGVAGRLTEVTRELAARMVADGVAQIARKDEAEAFRQKLVEEKKQADQKRASERIQFAVLTETDLRALRGDRGDSKD